MLFPTFIEKNLISCFFVFYAICNLFTEDFLWGGGGGVWITAALLRPGHITGSPVVISIHVSFLGHADIRF